MPKDVSDSPMLELTLETAEIVADTLHDNELLEAFPVVGAALKLCKAVDNIRDRFFIAKLQRFLYATDAAPEMKAKFRAEAEASPEQTSKFGESICLILDRITDLRKAELIGVLFVAYASDVISLDQLQRLTHAVDAAFIADIESLLSWQGVQDDSTQPWAQHLLPSGLTEINGANSRGVTKLGHSFRDAYSHYQVG